MKKLIAVLCLVLLVVSASCAMASTTTGSSSVTVQDVDTNLFEGKWVETEAPFVLYLPVEWVADTAAVEADESVIAAYTDEDNTHSVIISAVTSEEMDGCETITQAMQKYMDEGYSGKLVKLSVNGQDAFGFMRNDGSYVVITLNPNGGFYRFVFTGATDEEYQAWIMSIIASITAK